MAEQLGFEQLLRDGAAVDGHERLARARAGAVDGAGQQLLAGAAFARDQHARIGGRHQAGLGQHIGHGLAAADDLFAPTVVTAGIALGPGAQAGGLADLVEQLVAVEGLGQVGESAARGGVHRIGDGAVRGQQDHRQGWMLGADLVEQLQSVQARQAHIADHQRGLGHGQLRQGGLGRFGGAHLVAGGAQAHGQQAQQVEVVVHQQDRMVGGHVIHLVV